MFLYYFFETFAHSCKGLGIYNPSERDSRTLLFYNLFISQPDYVLQKMKSKHVLILGCGGIGNFIAYFLASSGIGKLTLVDMDTIELSNLNRQCFFTEEDVGKKKSEILKRELLKRNSSLEIDIIPFHITSEADLELLPRVDLIVQSADTPRDLTFWVNNYSIRRRIPFISIGYVVDIAVWGPFVVPGKTGCWCCSQLVVDCSSQSEEAKMWLQKINHGFRPPSIGPINALAAAGAALDVLRFFIGEEPISFNKRVGLWTHGMFFEFQSCVRNKECPVCSSV